MELITDLFEALTIFCFGLSWPISIRKSWVSRTAKGKSLFFEIFLGFIFYLSFFFYVLNFIEISIDVALYFRNTKLDKLAEENK